MGNLKKVQCKKTGEVYVVDSGRVPDWMEQYNHISGREFTQEEIEAYKLANPYQPLKIEVIDVPFKPKKRTTRKKAAPKK